MHSVKMTKELLSFHLRTGHKAYISNEGAKDATLNTHERLGSFGKGPFKMLKPTDEIADRTHVFELHNQDSLVIFNGVVTTLAKVILEQRKSKPDAGLCYHKLILDAEEPTKFNVEPTHSVSFTPADSATAPITAMNMFGKEPLRVWQDSDVVAVIWVVRWGAKGLMPVKPEARLACSMVIPSGKVAIVTMQV